MFWVVLNMHRPRFTQHLRKSKTRNHSQCLRRRTATISRKAADLAALPYFVTFANAALIKSMPISLPDSSSALRTAVEASPAL
jgi:hypothetical protein